MEQILKFDPWGIPINREAELYDRANPRPLGISTKSETMTFTIATALGVTAGVISAIRVQDISTGKWYNWDRPGPFTPTPVCTPGVNNLYIAVWAVNNGVAGNVTIKVTDDTGATLGTKTQNIPFGGSGFGLEMPNLTMPARNYSITIKVTP